ncbi:hypothetical protein PybrP1_006490, partial [[Pythium] brassicae (nom. inval.)]
GEYGTERLVFSDQEICDDLIATIPKLHDAVRRDISSDTPRHLMQKKEGVEKYLVPLASGDDDIDLVHSVVAKTELRCHINEVLNVLVNQDSSSHDATMKALNGKKFTQGDVLFQQRCKLVPGDTMGSVSSPGAAGTQASQSGLISVKLATIKPKFSLKFGRNHKRVQKLCLGTFTHKYPSNDRAVHKDSSAEFSRRRDALMNPEAKHVLDLLTNSLSQFERVIRRRRLGLQTFVYFPKQYENSRVIKSCAICLKLFKFYRRDFFCQLCGQMTCGDCSRMHEAEVSAGEISMKRVCLMCVARVDNNDDREWYDDDRFHRDFVDDDSSFGSSSSTRDSESSSDSASMDQMTHQLHSDDPTQWSLALEKLEHLVSPTAKHDY